MFFFSSIFIIYCQDFIFIWCYLIFIGNTYIHFRIKLYFCDYKHSLWKIVHCAIFKWHLFILEKIIPHILIKTFCIYHAFQVFRNRLLFKYLFKKKQQNVQNFFFNCKEAFSNSIVNKHNILRVNKWCQLKWVNKKTKKKFY